MAIVKPVILEDGQLKTAGVGDQVPQSFVHELDTALEAKVDKVAGKQLSDENYTLTEKQKLSGVADEATKNRDDSENADKVHTHPAEQVTGLDSALAEKVSNTDSRLTDSREWSEETVTQAEAEAGVSSTRRAWTAQRVRQAINAWWQLVTSGFGRNLVSASNEQAARNVLQLTYPSTAPTVGEGDEVMRSGAYGIGGTTTQVQSYPVATTQTGFSNFANPTDPALPMYGMSVVFGGRHTLNTAAHSNWLGQLYSDTMIVAPTLRFRSSINGEEWGQPVTLYSSVNLLNIGTTATSARAALNLFADASGVMTNGPGQLSNDMSNFLSSNTFDEMSSKVGGGGEIDFTIIATNATALTPQPGKSYWLNRNTSALLTTTLTCTHRPGKIRSWHMIVSKNAGADVNFIPKFALTGLSQPFVAWSGGGVEPPVVSGVSHVMIAFTQIDQSVRAMVVDGW